MRADSTLSTANIKGTPRCKRTIVPKPFICKVCLSCFSKKYYLQVHIMIHTGERPHTCDICGKGFRMRWRVALHRRTHTGEKPYGCPVCSFSGNRKDNIYGHMRRRHGGVFPIRDASGKNRKTATGPKKRRTWKRKSRRMPKKQAQELSQDSKPFVSERDAFSSQNNVPLQSSQFVFQHAPHVLQQPHQVIPDTPPLPSRSSVGQDPLMIQPPPEPETLLASQSMYPVEHHASRVILDDPELKKNGRIIFSAENQVSEVPYSKDSVHTLTAPCQVYIKEEPQEPVVQYARPRREAANLGHIRRISMMLDEEDIKKEIGDEDAVPPARRGPRKGRRGTKCKQFSPILKSEGDLFEPPVVWATEEDLLFTDDDTLKLEEDMDLLE
ncbi:zinc finger protein 148-like [Penaeus chinensis]|uniref:zinc finger protein 148-like n=1 Tax=Penaeus chinensis TaxID=139456 RepID=UPI001FB6D908|nr:zinc finger protein 148-like [Penaeus chinensis]XP_047489891.1 zinc finger protein 148-like [Penaeus chinensis]